MKTLFVLTATIAAGVYCLGGSGLGALKIGEELKDFQNNRIQNVENQYLGR